MRKGEDNLKEKVRAFNTQHVRQPGIALTAYPGLDADGDAADLLDAIGADNEDDIVIIDDI